MNNYNDYGGGYDDGLTPAKSNNTKTIIIVIVVVLAAMGLCCCFPFMGPAFQVVASYKSEILGEIDAFDTPGKAVVVDVQEVSVELHNGKIHTTEYSITYEYEYNGITYREPFMETYDEPYRSVGDKVDILIKSEYPNQFCETQYIEKAKKRNKIILAVAIAILFMPVIVIIALVLIIKRAFRRKKNAYVDNYGVDLYSMEERDPNDDYRG